MMNEKYKYNKNYFLCSFLIYLLFLCFLSFSLKSIYLSQDESFTFNLIHKSFGQIMKLTAMDVHPFMYYFVAKVFVLPFHNIFIQILSLRLLSAIPYFILLVIGNTTIRYRFGNQVSLMFMFSIITMPFLNKYMYIARMYSMAMLFTTLTFLLLVYIYKNFIPNSLLSAVVLSIFSLMAAYSHYFSLIACAIMYIIFFVIFLLRKRKVIYIILSAIIDIVLYLPWMIMVLFRQLKEVKGTFWTTPLTIKNIIKSFVKIFSPIMDVPYSNLIELFDAVIILLFITILLFLYIYYKQYKNVLTNVGISIFIFTFVIGIMLSILMHHSILLPRFFVTVLGVVYFSISLFIGQNVNLNHVPKKIFIICLVIFGLTSYSFNIYNLMSNNRIFTNSLSVINKVVPRGSRIIYSSNAPSSSLSSYLYNDTNIILTKNPRTMKLYNTVFNRQSKNNLYLNNSSNTFFIKSTNDVTTIDNKFYKKFESQLIPKGYICSPIDNNHKSILYKISK